MHSIDVHFLAVGSTCFTKTRDISTFSINYFGVGVHIRVDRFLLTLEFTSMVACVATRNYKLVTSLLFGLRTLLDKLRNRSGIT